MTLNTILGILLVLSFIGMIVYCVKGGNLMVGFFILTIIWAVLGRVPVLTTVNIIFEKTIENYGATIGVIIFGSWFGRILVETGIAGSIIRKTVELGGDKPIVTTILLSWATSFIFTSAFGVGSVMAIGVIVLPILFSMGVPKRVAVASYIMAVASGMYLNMGYVKQIQAFFPSVKYDNAYIKVAFIMTAVHMLVILAFIIFSFRKNGVNHAWAASSSEPSSQDIPMIAFLTPAIPIIMVLVFKWQPIPALGLAMIFGLLCTRYLKTYKGALAIIQKTLHDGVADVGLLIGMLFAIASFGAVAKAASPMLVPLIGSIIPKNPLVLVIAFAILAPAALFRGPLMVFGAGGATLAILMSMNIFTPQFLFMLIAIPPIAMVANTCPTQSWGMWAINYSKISPKDYLKTGIVWSWIIVIANEFIAYNLFR
ncbi:hypothetical protein [Clostridium sp.]